MIQREVTSRWTKLRKFAYVARSLHTKKYVYRKAQYVGGPIVHTSHPKAFRRAFVAASLKPSVRVEVGPIMVQFMVFDTLVASFDRVTRKIRKHEYDWFCPFSLTPTNIRNLANRVHRERWKIIEQHYKNQAPKGTLRLDDHCAGYIHSRIRAVRPLIIHAIKSFTEASVPHVVSAFRSAGMQYLTGDRMLRYVNAMASRGEGPARILFALKTWPALMRALMLRPNCKGEFDDIFDGVPPAKVLSKALDIPHFVVRRMIGVTTQRTGFLITGPDSPLDLMQHLPQHVLPRSRRDWLVLGKIVHPVLQELEDGRTSYNWWGGGLPVYEEQWNQLVPCLFRGVKKLSDLEQIRTALLTFVDALQSLNGAIARLHHVATADDNSESTAQWRRLAQFYGGIRSMSLPQMARLSTAYHQAHDRITRQVSSSLLGESDPTSWPGLMPEAQLDIPNSKIVAVELLSSGELLKEGAALSHCVGSYDSPCLMGESRIVSLRQDGRSLSTIEFVQERVDGKPILHIGQHFGRDNRDPSARCLKAARWLHGYLKKKGRKRWPKKLLAKDKVTSLIEVRMMDFWMEQA
ncbi:PcfJ domain-containing protein [Denitratimonas sp. CY0512]|uniref:PcfJ domain-containing protein n=1 Tax=Denitratimonas sp. CY0512 TaxID=3131940 RepID=UPI0030A77C3F